MDNIDNLSDKIKALPPREPGDAKKLVLALDTQFTKVFDAALGTYYINKQINKIIVIIGIVLIGYALIYHTYSSFVLNQSDNVKNQPGNNLEGSNSVVTQEPLISSNNTQQTKTQLLNENKLNNNHFLSL